MKRPVRVEFAGAIFISILFVLVVGIVELANTDALAPASSPTQRPQVSTRTEPVAVIPDGSDCMQMEANFASKLDESRSCQADSDCSLARFECPFECVSSLSTLLLDELKQEEAEFLRSCKRCTSTCPQVLTKWRAACVRNRCIVMDYSVDDLEEETLRLIN